MPIARRDPNLTRARLYLEHITRAIIAHAATRRQRIGQGEGARPPASLAAPRVQLQTLQRALPGGKVEPITPLGYQTATRALPPILAALPATDRRRIAADLIATACERIGAVKGCSPDGGGGGAHSAGANDGGATTRVKHAARLRVVEALANGWPADPLHGGFRKGGEKIILAVGRPTEKRRNITAMGLLRGVCVEGQDMREILRAHGWSEQSRCTRVLVAATLEMLERIGAGLGH